jgi:hypothetical protein
MASENPTFARHNENIVNFQFVGEFYKLEDTQIKIIFGTGVERIWTYEDSDSRDSGYDSLCDLYVDDV